MIFISRRAEEMVLLKLSVDVRPLENLDSMPNLMISGAAKSTGHT